MSSVPYLHVSTGETGLEVPLVVVFIVVIFTISASGPSKEMSVCCLFGYLQ